MLREENDEPLYCICRSTDVSRFMIGCDHCEEWYHGNCINVTEQEANKIKRFFCKKCRKKNPDLKIKYKDKSKHKQEHEKEKERNKEGRNEHHKEKYNLGKKENDFQKEKRNKEIRKEKNDQEMKKDKIEELKKEEVHKIKDKIEELKKEEVHKIHHKELKKEKVQKPPKSSKYYEKCRQCEACYIVEDCGRCETCINWQSFGGSSGTIKQRCKKRQCHNFVHFAQPENNVSRIDNPPFHKTSHVKSESIISSRKSDKNFGKNSKNYENLVKNSKNYNSAGRNDSKSERKHDKNKKNEFSNDNNKISRSSHDKYKRNESNYDDSQKKNKVHDKVKNNSQVNYGDNNRNKLNKINYDDDENKNKNNKISYDKNKLNPDNNKKNNEANYHDKNKNNEGSFHDKNSNDAVIRENNDKNKNSEDNYHDKNKNKNFNHDSIDKNINNEDNYHDKNKNKNFNHDSIDKNINNEDNYHDKNKNKNFNHDSIDKNINNEDNYNSKNNNKIEKNSNDFDIEAEIKTNLLDKLKKDIEDITEISRLEKSDKILNGSSAKINQNSQNGHLEKPPLNILTNSERNSVAGPGWESSNNNSLSKRISKKSKELIAKKRNSSSIARKRKNRDSDSDSDMDMQWGPQISASEARQCYGPQCVKAARPCSKYCSHECGLKLAEARIYSVLPQRIQEWKMAACVSEERDRKQLAKIRAQQLEARKALQALDEKHKELDSKLLKWKSVAIDESAEDDDETVESAFVYCVTCGHEISVKRALKHMHACFNKLESQMSFGSMFKTRIEGNNMFCDFYNAGNMTYCKRLRVMCPEHMKNTVSSTEVCGYPLTSNVFTETGKVCRVAKKRCTRHTNWEKLRRATIDMERVRQCLKLDELVEQERQVRISMTNRAGVLGLMLHSTYDHDYAAKFQKQKSQQASSHKQNAPENMNVSPEKQSCPENMQVSPHKQESLAKNELVYQRNQRNFPQKRGNFLQKQSSAHDNSDHIYSQKNKCLFEQKSQQKFPHQEHKSQSKERTDHQYFKNPADMEKNYIQLELKTHQKQRADHQYFKTPRSEKVVPVVDLTSGSNVYAADQKVSFEKHHLSNEKGLHYLTDQKVTSENRVGHSIEQQVSDKYMKHPTDQKDPHEKRTSHSMDPNPGFKIGSHLTDQKDPDGKGLQYLTNQKDPHDSKIDPPINQKDLHEKMVDHSTDIKDSPEKNPHEKEIEQKDPHEKGIEQTDSHEKRLNQKDLHEKRVDQKDSHGKGVDHQYHKNSNTEEKNQPTNSKVITDHHYYRQKTPKKFCRFTSISTDDQVSPAVVERRSPVDAVRKQLELTEKETVNKRPSQLAVSSSPEASRPEKSMKFDVNLSAEKLPRFEEKSLKFAAKSPKFEEKTPKFRKESLIFEENSPKFVLKSPKLEEKSPKFNKESPIFEEKTPKFRKESVIFEENSPKFALKSPKFEEKSPKFNKESPIFEEKTPKFKEKSPKFEEKSPKFKEKSPIFEEKSPKFKEKSPIFEEKTPKFKEKSPIFEEKSQKLEGNLKKFEGQYKTLENELQDIRDEIVENPAEKPPETSEKLTETPNLAEKLELFEAPISLKKSEKSTDDNFLNMAEKSQIYQKNTEITQKTEIFSEDSQKKSEMCHTMTNIVQYKTQKSSEDSRENSETSKNTNKTEKSPNSSKTLPQCSVNLSDSIITDEILDKFSPKKVRRSSHDHRYSHDENRSRSTRSSVDKKQDHLYSSNK